MTPEQKNLREFIGTANTVFNIPIYQRNYVWKAPQCEQLYKDVVSIITGKAIVLDIDYNTKLCSV